MALLLVSFPSLLVSYLRITHSHYFVFLVVVVLFFVLFFEWWQIYQFFTFLL